LSGDDLTAERPTFRHAPSHPPDTFISPGRSRLPQAARSFSGRRLPMIVRRSVAARRIALSSVNEETPLGLCSDCCNPTAILIHAPTTPLVLGKAGAVESVFHVIRSSPVGVSSSEVADASTISLSCAPVGPSVFGGVLIPWQRSRKPLTICRHSRALSHTHHLQTCPPH
jgi:hypothetical protein